MKNLILFILRNHYVLLFILLESVSFVMVVRYNSYQHTSFINSSAAVAGRVNSVFSTVNNYLSLNQRNQELNDELARLRTMMPESSKIDTLAAQTAFDSVYTQQYEYLPCRVISNSVKSANNFLTLDIGSKHGVEPGMAVVSAMGAVGVVKAVSPNFSSVISLLNQNLKISAMLEKSGYFGSLGWEGGDYRIANLEDLPGHITVRKGDVVITSGYSTIFPKGVMIGNVESVTAHGVNGFMSASVRLSVDFKRLSNVQVVRNLLKKEQLELQERAENE